jgi:hypothetical protein
VNGQRGTIYREFRRNQASSVFLQEAFDASEQFGIAAAFVSKEDGLIL